MPHSIDLHTHSAASDGVLAPGELVVRAHRAGISLLALTDHDEVNGCEEAHSTALTLGMRFLHGVEISVTWSAMTIHIIGLGIDSDNRELQQGLEKNRHFRSWRAVEMGRRLEKRGIPGGYEAASRLAGGRIVSRTHFAKFLVEKGLASDVRAVFQHYLKPGKAGYVSGQWATLEEAVAWILAANGVAVIAHPARYRLTAGKLRRLLQQFIAAGGAGIEVVSGGHCEQDIPHLATLAKRHGLQASVGSDFHDPDYSWSRLGMIPQLPPECDPVWQQFLEKAENRV
ncbi:MAG: PHP domain-containing protein [Gammaproteobacteria bacterium]|nr:PHP domain-containing protein [Gammaproteobacteria bacterium]